MFNGDQSCKHDIYENSTTSMVVSSWNWSQLGTEPELYITLTRLARELVSVWRRLSGTEIINAITRKQRHKMLGTKIPKGWAQTIAFLWKIYCREHRMRINVAWDIYYWNSILPPRHDSYKCTNISSAVGCSIGISRVLSLPMNDDVSWELGL